MILDSSLQVNYTRYLLSLTGVSFGQSRTPCHWIERIHRQLTTKSCDFNRKNGCPLSKHYSGELRFMFFNILCVSVD